MARVLVFMPAAGEVYDHNCIGLESKKLKVNRVAKTFTHQRPQNTGSLEIQNNELISYLGEKPRTVILNSVSIGYH